MIGASCGRLTVATESPISRKNQRSQLGPEPASITLPVRVQPNHAPTSVRERRTSVLPATPATDMVRGPVPTSANGPDDASVVSFRSWVDTGASS